MSENTTFHFPIILFAITWFIPIALSAQGTDSLLGLQPQLEGTKKVDSLNYLAYELPVEEGIKMAEKALALSEEIGYEFGRGDAYTNIGLLYNLVSKNGKAEENLLAAIGIFEKLNCKCVELLDALEGMSLLKLETEQYQEALAYAIRESELAVQYKLIDKIIHSNLQLAEIYRLIDYDEMFETYARKALQMATEFLDTLSVAEAEFMIALNLSENGELDSALFYYKNALVKMENSSESIIQHYYVPSIYSEIAQIHFQKGDFERAIYLAKNNLRRIAEANDKYLAAFDQATLAEAHLKLGEIQAAKSFAEKALENAIETEGLDLLDETYRLLRDISKETEEHEKYVAYNEQYLIYHDSLIDIKRTKLIAGIKAKYDVEQERKLNAALIEKNSLLQTRNLLMSLLAIGLLLIASALGYLFYKIKKQKSTIVEQNLQLENLNATKDRFFAIIAHDMRNAVYNFRGVTDKIAFFIKKNQPQRINEFGDQINTAVSNLTNLMNNLLEWALTQKGAIPYQPEPLKVNDAVQEVLAAAKDVSLQKGIVLESDIPEKVCVFADKNGLATILRNLISNSLKFTCRGGKVQIRAENKGQSTIIEVRDSGMGIESLELEKLFQIDKKKIRRGTGGEKGSGLGLVLVKELVELNRGTISVQSEEGRGTIISFSLPKARE